MKTYTQDETEKMRWSEIRDAIIRGDKVIGFFGMEITLENAEIQAKRETEAAKPTFLV
jgi:hypothetical protein